MCVSATILFPRSSIACASSTKPPGSAVSRSTATSPAGGVFTVRAVTGVSVYPFLSYVLFIMTSSSSRATAEPSNAAVLTRTWNRSPGFTR